MAIHSGEADLHHRGTDVNRCARLRGLAHGGQILVSSRTAALLEDLSPSETTLVDLGEYELRGLLRPERVYQVRHPGLLSQFPPIATSSMEKHISLPGPLGPELLGRTDILHAIDKSLRKGEVTVHLVALVGLGGIGKTAVALEYARGLAETARIVWWVDATTETGAIAAFASLARDAGLFAEDDDRSVVDLVHEWLGYREGWVLVFDNASHPHDLIRLVPRRGSGVVLVTSRFPDWELNGSTIEVPGLPKSEAIALLRRRWPEAGEDGLNRLTERVDGHPLALWQAISYSRLSGVSAETYLDLLETQMAELLHRGQAPPDYPLSTAATVDLAVKALGEEAPLAVHLLGNVAYLGPTPIPSIVIRAISHPEDVMRPVRMAIQRSFTGVTHF